MLRRTVLLSERRLLTLYSEAAVLAPLPIAYRCCTVYLVHIALAAYNNPDVAALQHTSCSYVAVAALLACFRPVSAAALLRSRFLALHYPGCAPTHSRIFMGHYLAVVCVARSFAEHGKGWPLGLKSLTFGYPKSISFLLCVEGEGAPTARNGAPLLGCYK